MNKQSLTTHFVELLSMAPERVVYPYPWVGHIPFAWYITKLLKPTLFVELGTHSGNSFNAICQAVKQFEIACKCVAIDSWEGDFQAGFYHQDIYHDLLRYQEENYKSFAHLKRKFFDDAIADFDDNSIDLLHIDGLHTYEAVRNDFESWKPKLSSSAVVLFHDTNVFEREFGVHRFFDEVAADYPFFEFKHSHGLGVLLVGKQVNEKVADFISFAAENANFVNSLFLGAATHILPKAAQRYLLELHLDSEKRDNEVAVMVELFESTDGVFDEQMKKYAYLNCEKVDGSYRLECQFNLYSDTSHVRLDPCHEALMLSENIKAWAVVDNEEVEIQVLSNNSVDSVNGNLLFIDDPQLTFSLPAGTTKVRFVLLIEEIGKELFCIFATRYKSLREKTDELINSFNRVNSQLSEALTELTLLEDISAGATESTKETVVNQFRVEFANLKTVIEQDNKLLLDSLMSALQKSHQQHTDIVAASQEKETLVCEQKKEQQRQYKKLIEAKEQLISKLMSDNASLKQVLLKKEQFIAQKKDLLSKLYADKEGLNERVHGLELELERLRQAISDYEGSLLIRISRKLRGNS